MRDRVLMQIVVPRGLRQRLRLLAVRRETSLRAVAHEAFERLLAAEDRGEAGAAEVPPCGRRAES